MKNLARSRNKITLLKYICLSLGICIMIAMTTSIYLKNSEISRGENELILKSNKSKLSKNYTLAINKSLYEGVSNNLTPYKIWAQSVAKDLKDQYLLKEVDCTYLFKEGDINIKSKHGSLDENNKILTLKNNVIIDFNGIIFNSQDLKLNLNNKNADCQTGVELKYNDSNIKSDNFRTEDFNNIIEFNGNVESIFDINNKK